MTIEFNVEVKFPDELFHYVDDQAIKVRAEIDDAYFKITALTNFDRYGSDRLAIAQNDYIDDTSWHSLSLYHYYSPRRNISFFGYSTPVTTFIYLEVLMNRASEFVSVMQNWLQNSKYITTYIHVDGQPLLIQASKAERTVIVGYDIWGAFPDHPRFEFYALQSYSVNELAQLPILVYYN